jgi:protein TonB
VWVHSGIGSERGDGPSDFLRSLLTAATHAPAPPVKVEPRPDPPKPPAAPIVVSKGVQEAMILVKTIPVYPAIAMKARIEGVVHLTALISREGTVTQLKVISGHPILIPAAIDAVRQWRYRPTLLSGVPTEVVTQVDVRFTLTR